LSTAIDTHTMTPRLFTHTLRPEWGMGLVVADEPERLRLQWEDGENRTFARDYLGLLENVEPEADDTETERVLEKLMRAVGVSRVRARIMKRGATDRPMQLDEQIAAFKEQYPKGFSDPAWLSASRGVGAKRQLKRHRDPSIADARRIFARDRMKSLRDEGKSGVLWNGFIEVLKKTDLATMKTDVKPLSDVGAAEQAVAMRRLYDLLYVDGSMTSQFNHWLASITFGDNTPSWALATTVPALVQPDRHFSVRPTKVRQQAKWMAPKLKVGRSPIGQTYQEIVTMALAVKTSLELEEVEPADLVDVADFMADTLTNKRKK
jgi:hypothetical protein